jgi:hypothetical protein
MEGNRRIAFARRTSVWMLLVSVLALTGSCCRTRCRVPPPYTGINVRIRIINQTPEPAVGTTGSGTPFNVPPMLEGYVDEFYVEPGPRYISLYLNGGGQCSCPFPGSATFTVTAPHVCMCTP